MRALCFAQRHVNLAGYLIDTKLASRRQVFKAIRRVRLTKYGNLRREDAEKAEGGQCDAINQYQTA